MIGRAFLLTIFSTAASADVCDYRLSSLLGNGAATASVALPAVTSATGVTANALGFYTLTHSVTGATMLGSTLAGTSGAGTVGIVAGTGTGIGATGAALMNPVGIGIGVLTAVGIGGSETYCYFWEDEVINDYQEVLVVMRGLDANADPDFFWIDEPNDPELETAAIFILGEDGVFDMFDVDNLYIHNGTLMHRDWGRNTALGDVGIQWVNPDAADAN